MIEFEMRLSQDGAIRKPSEILPVPAVSRSKGAKPKIGDLKKLDQDDNASSREE